MLDKLGSSLKTSNASSQLLEHGWIRGCENGCSGFHDALSTLLQVSAKRIVSMSSAIPNIEGAVEVSKVLGKKLVALSV